METMMATATDSGDSLTTDEPALFTPRERAIAGAAWNRGFSAGVEAGERCMENGGMDEDDVNPFTGERPNARISI